MARAIRLGTQLGELAGEALALNDELTKAEERITEFARTNAELAQRVAQLLERQQLLEAIADAACRVAFRAPYSLGDMEELRAALRGLPRTGAQTGAQTLRSSSIPANPTDDNHRRRL
jgi:hypothetical protein